MKLRALGSAFLFCLAGLPVQAADSAYSLKVAASRPAPQQVAEPIRKLLDDRCLQLLDEKGEVLMEVWLCKDVPVKATEAQVKNGLTYREVQETTLFGVLRMVKENTDYRKQKIEPGVYTLRLAHQPMDGDHMGTAPYSDFLLTVPAADDKDPVMKGVKRLHEASTKSAETHPGVFLLFPGKDAGDKPKLINKGEGHWVLFFQVGAKAGEKKAVLPMGLTLIGASSAA